MLERAQCWNVFDAGTCSMLERARCWNVLDAGTCSMLERVQCGKASAGHRNVTVVGPPGRDATDNSAPTLVARIAINRNP